MITLADISKIVNGTVEGDPNLVIIGPSKIDEGLPGTISFLSNPKYESHIYSTKASAVLVSKEFQPLSPLYLSLLRVEDVYLALSTLMEAFGEKGLYPSEISKMSSIDDSVTFGPNVGVGDFTVIKSGVSVGSGTVLMDQVYVGQNVAIGENCIIHPGVKLYHGCILGNDVVVHSNTVIGSDGFGFAPDENGVYNKITQIGIVKIGNNVEIGSNCSIDRASMGSTVIEDGAKLDNLIQVAHNVKIGKNTVIAAQTGIAGSSTIGSRAIIGGQVGIVGHVNVADGTLLQAKSGVASNISEADKKWYGYPAIEYQKYLRSYAYFKKLPEIVAKLRKVEKSIDKLRDKTSL